MRIFAVSGGDLPLFSLADAPSAAGMAVGLRRIRSYPRLGFRELLGLRTFSRALRCLSCTALLAFVENARIGEALGMWRSQMLSAAFHPDFL